MATVFSKRIKVAGVKGAGEGDIGSVDSHNMAQNLLPHHFKPEKSRKPEYAQYSLPFLPESKLSA